MIEISMDFKDLIPPLSVTEYQLLEENIISEGCRDSLVCWNDYVIDGHNRYEICLENNIHFNTIHKDFADEMEVKEWMINNQFARRNLSPFVRAELALKLKPIIAARAKEQQGSRTDILQNSVKGMDTQKIIAQKAGVSHDTIAKTEQILEKADEETKAQLRTGEISINHVYKTIIGNIKKEKRRDEIEAQAEEIQASDNPAIEKAYHVICIDPPWPYRDGGGKKGDPADYDPEGHRASNPYPEMSLAEIAEIEIPAAADCVLWLWTTHKFMRHSFGLLDQWGFEDKAILTWVKDRMGLGRWLRSKSEFCIMAIKGKPLINLTNQTTILNGKMREHSRKPDEFYSMVDELCTGAKLDYFSRETREGWDQVGNDKEKF